MTLRKQKHAKPLDSATRRGSFLVDYYRQWFGADMANMVVKASGGEESILAEANSSRAGLGAFSVAAVLILVLFGAAGQYEQGRGLQKEILGSATTGFEQLLSGADQLLERDLEQARTSFDLAGQSFAAAEHSVRGAGGVLGGLIEILPQGQAAENILAAGTNIAGALDHLTLGLSEFSSTRLVWDEVNNASAQDFYTSIKNSRQELVQSIDQMRAAASLLEQVSPDVLPEEYRERLAVSGAQLAFAADALDELARLQGLVLDLIGGRAKNYLVIFQNNNEGRVTGGFIGTYGILQFENGRASIRKIESIYALDGQIREQVEPPLPLARLLTDRWGTRDSNWFVDFPASARKAMEFYENTTGEVTDGVISFTPDVFEQLLELTGPIAMPEYGEILTAENFRDLAQYKTSVDYDREENRPKKFLADFAPRFLGQLSQIDEEQWLSLIDIFSRQIYSGQILAFSLDSGTQESFRHFGLTGEITETSGDYLAIFHSNVGGGKTNLGISEQVEKNVFVDQGGSIEVELVITRTHNSFTEEFFPRNVDFMRVLVPPGSRLTSASGFDDFPLSSLAGKRGGRQDPDVAFWEQQLAYDDETGVYTGYESGYTEFSGWLELMPGQSRVVVLTYRLPFRMNRTYTQLVQKQPGSRPFEFVWTLNTPNQLIYAYPEASVRLEGGSATINEQIAGDRFHAVVGE